MRTLGNILWHIPFCGFLTAIFTYVFGLILTVTVVAAPIGLGLMQFGKFLFAPFGRVMVKKSDLGVQENKAWKAYSTIVSLLYLPFGIVFCLIGVVQVFGLCICIVGILLAIVVAKSLSTFLNPVGKQCVRASVAQKLEEEKAEAELQRIRASAD